MIRFMFSLALVAFLAPSAPSQTVDSVSTRDMSDINWMEFKEAVPSKINTVLLPTGTLEPHGVINNGADITAPVAIARCAPFSLTTIPIISTSSGGSSSFSTSSESAICGTDFGETNETASMCLNPALISAFYRLRSSKKFVAARRDSQPTDQSSNFLPHGEEIEQVRDRKGQEASP